MATVVRIGPERIDWVCPGCSHIMTDLVRQLSNHDYTCAGCWSYHLSDYTPVPVHTAHQHDHG